MLRPTTGTDPSRSGRSPPLPLPAPGAADDRVEIALNRFPSQNLQRFLRARDQRGCVTLASRRDSVLDRFSANARRSRDHFEHRKSFFRAEIDRLVVATRVQILERGEMRT